MLKAKAAFSGFSVDDLDGRSWRCARGRLVLIACCTVHVLHLLDRPLQLRGRLHRGAGRGRRRASRVEQRCSCFADAVGIRYVVEIAGSVPARILGSRTGRGRIPFLRHACRSALCLRLCILSLIGPNVFVASNRFGSLASKQSVADACGQWWLTDTSAPPKEEKNGECDFEQRYEKQNSRADATCLATGSRHRWFHTEHTPLALMLTENRAHSVREMRHKRPGS